MPGRDGVAEFLDTIERGSRSRPTFELSDARDFARRPVRLSTGPARETLICFPALLALCGPHQFARFSQGFRGVREVLVPHIAGFLAEEHLPASIDVAIDHQMTALEDAIGPDAPAVLAGYSTGGAFAYVLAGRLEAAGRRVDAVVLLDTYPPGPGGIPAEQEEAIVQRLLNNREWQQYLNETRLTAMGSYIRALRTVDLRPVKAPTLLLRASQPMDAGADDDWRAWWPFPHDTSDVLGDHYSILQLHARTAAQAVESWLQITLGDAAQSPTGDQRRASE